MKINFNVPPYTGKELEYIKQAVEDQKICGDGDFTARCNRWIEERTGAAKALLTTSCTHATEMSAVLLNIGPSDEVIMPSYTFVSTANGFVLRGGVPVFVDIRPDTMNMDENLIESAITEKTKAIVVMHYAGVGCEMDAIMDIAKRHGLFVVEDAAQAIMASYKGRPLGAIGDMGNFSFHETKNLSCGEGGALTLRDERWADQAVIIREKGTNRTLYKMGKVDKYSWIAPGSSWLPSELNAAYLFAQMEMADFINERRLHLWERYNEAFAEMSDSGLIERPTVPEYCKHNAHMYYIKCRDFEERKALIEYLLSKEILPASHYIPLHSSKAGLLYGRFHGEDRYTTKESERLLRLPMYYALTEEDQDEVILRVKEFYNAV
ncbi:MAG: dTDP-4-amino-4,6-dideoxygalactose transaminase [Lachnospiraceae bacterium]|nr:dTDP-4-amino-4,6-dideoxygalactose transaminase [Lachnospiraceae bacterium]